MPRNGTDQPVNNLIDGKSQAGKFQSKNRVADKATTLAVKLLETWDQFRSRRLNDIRENERAYYGEVRPTLKGRNNIAFNLLAKYVDELKAGMDDAPTVEVSHGRLAKLLIAKKLDSLAQRFKKPTRGDWARKDRMMKTGAIFSGLGTLDKYSERDGDGKFQDHLDVVDINDLVAEAKGGSDLEEHCIVGKFPFFRTKAEMWQRANAGIYDPGQVKMLMAKFGSSDYKRNNIYFQNKYDRYKALGLDMETNSYVGQPILALAQVQMEYEGRRYMVTFDYHSGIWVRFKPLIEVYTAGNGKYSMTAFQTHEDPANLLSKSIVDDVMPISEAVRKIVNMALDNYNKRVWGQRAYDPNFFPNSSELEWNRPDQLVIARSYLGKPIANGIYEFKTEDSTGVTINFLKYFDDFVASLTGVNPNTPTNTDQKVGVLFGNLQKQGARLGVWNKSYKEMWEKVEQRFVEGVYDNLEESEVVKIIGTNGAEWTELTKEELKGEPDFDYNAKNATVEFEMAEAKKKRQLDAAKLVVANETLLKQFNPRTLGEEIMILSEFSEDRVKRMMDTKNYGNEDQLSRADAAVEAIMEGRKPDIYPGADISFYQYIYDKAVSLSSREMKKKVQIMAYGRAHMKIVVHNMSQKAITEAMFAKAEAAMAAMVDPKNAGAPGGGAPGQGMPGGPGSGDAQPAVPTMPQGFLGGRKGPARPANTRKPLRLPTPSPAGVAPNGGPGVSLPASPAGGGPGGQPSPSPVMAGVQ